MAELEVLGTEQNRKIWGQHGVRGASFGVSYANLYAIQKRIKQNHALALDLWETGNHDARVLATLVADPVEAEQGLPGWIAGVEDSVLGTALTAYAAKSPDAARLALAWKDHEGEFHGQVAWGVLSSLALSDHVLPDETFGALIGQIEREIHERKNRVRYSMLNVLIAIGSRGEPMKAQALAAATRIGKVHVDHGATSCKTPNPLAEIEKTYARRRLKKA